jgi:hypothetical protein
MEVLGSVPADATDKTWVVQGKHPCIGVMVAKNQRHIAFDPLRLLNPRNEEVSIPRGTPMAELARVMVGRLMLLFYQRVKKLEKPLNIINSSCGRWWRMLNKALLTLEEKEQLFALLLEYHGIFAKTMATREECSTRKTPGIALPIRQQVHRIPQFQRQEAKKLIDDYVGQGSHPAIR